MRTVSLCTLLLIVGCGDPPPPAQFALEPCASDFGPSALCAWHDVPENRADTTARSIRIRVVVLPARNGDSAEPVLLFPGGPGQATTDLIDLAGAYPRIGAERDLVFVGQRGTGESNPLHCAEGIAAEPERAFGSLFDPTRVATCRSEAEATADPSHYTTEAYIGDVAEVLDLLGHRRALLWGGSGGTRTALAFMREYGDRVVGTVLDGVTPLDAAMPSSFARYAQTAWERVVEDCSEQPDCAEAFPTLGRDFETILERLAAGPARTTVTGNDGTQVEVDFTAGDFAYAVRGMLYNAAQVAQLPRRVSETFRTRDYSDFAQGHYERSAALRSTVVAMGLHLTIYCAEDIPRIDAAAEEESSSGTFLGGYLVEQYSAACASWTVAPKADDWYRPFTSDVPVLLLSGYYDPSTPASAAERVASNLTSYRHLVVRNVGHGAGFSCARTTVERFLVEGSFAGYEDPCPNEPVFFQITEGTD